MASLAKIFADQGYIFRILPRLYCTSGSNKSPKETASKPEKSSSASSEPSPPKAATTEPFDNTQYRAGEYYQYNDLSFYDIDNDMASYRLPQQSSLKRPQP